jgi:hypothetical protein
VQVLHELLHCSVVVNYCIADGSIIKFGGTELGYDANVSEGFNAMEDL